MTNYDEKLKYIIWRDGVCWAGGDILATVDSRVTFGHIYPKPRTGKAAKRWAVEFAHFGDSTLNGHAVAAHNIGKSEGARWTDVEVRAIERVLLDNQYLSALLNCDHQDSVYYNVIQDCELYVLIEAGITADRIYNVLYRHPVSANNNVIEYVGNKCAQIKTIIGE
jgi:hypothetical protein